MSAVTADYVAALRASLIGDEQTFTRLSTELQAREGGEHSGDIYSALTGMALFIAARRRFPNGYTGADVVRFVGHVRATFADSANDIDPRVAERTLRGALGDAAAAENLDKAVRQRCGEACPGGHNAALRPVIRMPQHRRRRLLHDLWKTEPFSSML